MIRAYLVPAEQWGVVHMKGCGGVDADEGVAGLQDCSAARIWEFCGSKAIILCETGLYTQNLHSWGVQLITCKSGAQVIFKLESTACSLTTVILPFKDTGAKHESEV